MKKLVLIGFLITIGVACKAQNFVSNSGGIIILNQSETAVPGDKFEKGKYIGPHVFGEEATEIRDDFEKAYVYYTETTGAYATEVKHVVKPVVYKSLIKYEKRLLKAVQKGEVDPIAAQQNFLDVFEIGVKLINYDTQKLESELQNIKKYDEVERYIRKIKFS